MNASIYAKPKGPRIILRPALATLVLHGLMIFALTVNWAAQDSKVVKVKPTPQVINAKLVDASDLKPKKAPKPVAKPKPKPKPKAKQAPKPAPKPAVKPKPVAKPKPAPPKPAPAKPKPEPRMTAAELAELARAELSQAMATEEQQQQEQAAVTAGEMAASYASLIQQTVVNYWSRPPSARNGMEVLLALQLIPTGEIVSVTVVKSSGNAAFDRSAVNAVQKADRFPELMLEGSHWIKIDHTGTGRKLTYAQH